MSRNSAPLPCPPVALPEDALGIGEDGPLVGPPDPTRRPGGIAVVGDQGSGKTACLARLAHLDARRGGLAVITIEAGKSVGQEPTPITQTLRGLDLTQAAREEQPQPFEAAVRHPEHAHVHSNDVQTRLQACRLVLDTLKRGRDSATAVSLFLDDADPLIPWLLTIVGGTPPELWLTVAWTVRGHDSTLALLRRFETAMILRHRDWDAASAVTDEINRRQGLT